MAPHASKRRETYRFAISEPTIAVLAKVLRCRLPVGGHCCKRQEVASRKASNVSFFFFFLPLTGATDGQRQATREIQECMFEQQKHLFCGGKRRKTPCDQRFIDKQMAFFVTFSSNFLSELLFALLFELLFELLDELLFELLFEVRSLPSHVNPTCTCCYQARFKYCVCTCTLNTTLYYLCTMYICTCTAVSPLTLPT